MARRSKLRQTCLLLLSLLTWLAALVQIAFAAKTVIAQGGSPLLSVINTLSYFTILTNLLVAIVSTASALRGEADTLLTRPSTQSAVAVYIFVVGLTYSFLLRAIWSPTGLNAFLNSALHDIVPILYILYWFVFVPKGTLRWSQPAGWLIYPVLYVIYCIARGALTGLYPYHFVDVTLLGYPRALLNTAGLLFGFWIVGLVIVAIDGLLSRRRTRIHA
ncbi:Pr6Pr family membrane protein [Granulicella sp. S190]|uniref:Pr6Pr family membrane protein n=1 Tax=Granulicella sp. S190 TaxID=1747226 RepID=UPI00131C2B92|nr:Pr6Pr family membrane protein [Granulicella sp. S190]